MREPSIHVTKKKLTLVLKEIKDNYDLKMISPNQLAELIVFNCKQFSLTGRQLNVDTAKLLKSTSKIVLSNRDDAGVFNSLLTLVRRQKNHRGISIIKVGSKDWPMVKEISSLAIEFCRDFKLNREEGFKIYLGLALDKMTKFSLHKFNTIHQSVCEDYDAKEKIKLDLTPNLTNQVKICYEKYLGEKGVINPYIDQPFKYIFFLKAKEQAIKYGVTNDHYIKAQFKGFEWCNSYPDPSQLIGAGAIDRLNKYLVENKIKPGQMEDSDKVKEAAQWLKNKWKNNKK